MKIARRPIELSFGQKARWKSRGPRETLSNIARDGFNRLKLTKEKSPRTANLSKHTVFLYSTAKNCIRPVIKCVTGLISTQGWLTNSARNSQILYYLKRIFMPMTRFTAASKAYFKTLSENSIVWGEMKREKNFKRPPRLQKIKTCLLSWIYRTCFAD